MLIKLKQRLRERMARATAQGKRPGLGTQAGMTLIEIMLVLAIIATVMGVLFGPTLINMFRGSRVKAAKILVDKYAMQAYVQWQTTTGDDCPDSIDTLSKYIGRKEAKDPWGKPLIVLCGDNVPEGAADTGIGIVSMGKDKKIDTKDDIKSWEKAPE